MINGHGDDIYAYPGITSNFSSNVPGGVNHDGLNRYLYENLSCIRSYPEPEPQATDFMECVKTRQPFALNERNGFRSATIVNMGAVALRLNRTLHFDPVKLTFIGDEAANRLLDQPIRSPWNI